MELIEIEENLNPSEVYSATMFLLQKKKYFRKLLWVILLPLIIPTCFHFFFQSNSNSGSPSIILIPLSFYTIIFLVPLLLSIYQSAKSKNTNITITENGFRRSNEKINIYKSWGEFNSWEETNKFIYLYFTKFEGIAHIIPKRAIKNKEEYSKIISILKTSITKNG